MDTDALLTAVFRRLLKEAYIGGFGTWLIVDGSVDITEEELKALEAVQLTQTEKERAPSVE